MKPKNIFIQDKDWKKEIIDYTLEISLIIILYSAQEGYE